MKLPFKIALTALLGLGAATASIPSASAAIACNAEGQCWHVRRPYAYPPAYGVVVHPDNWRWAPVNGSPGENTQVAAIGVTASGSVSDPD